MRPTRDAFRDEIVALGQSNQDIYVIDCDIAKSCKTDVFAKKLPEQHINVGIAEQNAAGIAAGLAACGKLPYVSTYAAFGSMRMLEQIRQVICYPCLNVKIACSHGGLTPANDGASHQCIEDMGILRTLPNMTVIMPADYHSARKLIRASAGHYGPLYLRFTRDPLPDVYGEDAEFAIGVANRLREGRDVAVIANGDTLGICLEACELLEADGISARLLDMHTIKPLDRPAVEEAIADIGKIVTVEDHNIYNGLGSAVSEVIAETGKGVLRRIGVQDRFGQSGPYRKLLEDNGIAAENIAAAAKELVG